MLNQVVTAFILKSEAIMEENPDVTMWVWRVSAGDRRSRKKVVESSRDWHHDSQDLIDEMWEAVNRLAGEPVDHAWLELLAKGQSREFHYEHIEISEPSDAPQVIMPDGKRVAIGTDYSQAVMATQLVRTNDQLLNFSMGLVRLNATLTQKQMDVAVAYTELETESRIMGQVDASNNMAEALKAFAPMVQAALLKYWQGKNPGDADDLKNSPFVSQDLNQGGGDSDHKSEDLSIPNEDDTVSDSEVDDLINRIEYVCQNHPAFLTESRIARVVTAFSSQKA